MNLPEINEYATRNEGSGVPEDIFSKILQVNKDSNIPLYGGDIVIKTGRSATDCTSCLWPKNADGTVLVPYGLSTAYSSGELDIFAIAMAEFETLTCVRFVPRTTEKDFLYIDRSDGCYTSVGKAGGNQTVNLAGACMNRGTVQHELNHALGFYHEHMRSDRDRYVEVRFQYIPKEYRNNFGIKPTNNLGLEYDYKSVMHYPSYAFSNTTNNTIVPIPDPNMPIGQRTGLSILDVSKINKLYDCNVCTTLLNNDKGSFTSANYPSAYPVNVNCVWLIRISDYNRQASLTFSGFDLQSTPKCNSDLRVYDGPKELPCVDG